jgi:hypothetical protein
MKAYTLELSGDQHLKLVAAVEAAVYLSTRDIKEFLQEPPWSDYGWTAQDLSNDPAQIKRADPDDEFMGSDLRELVRDLQDANELLAMLRDLQGRCEECGTSGGKLYECDKAYLCERCREKWENE